jgi:hypothetical protein
MREVIGSMSEDGQDTLSKKEERKKENSLTLPFSFT